MALNGEIIKHVITTYVVGGSPNVRALAVGVAIGYAVQKEKYHHLPLTFLSPIAYLGYHSYEKRDELVTWLRATLL